MVFRYVNNTQNIFPFSYIISQQNTKTFLTFWYQSQVMVSEMSTEGGFVQPSIPQLDGHYDHWFMLIENFLRSKEYWSLIEDGIPTVIEGVQPTSAQMKAIEDAKLKDLKAKNYLFQSIDCSILEMILNKDSAKSIWDSLKMKYQGTTRVQRTQQ
jgi:hypothetical protein